MRDPDIIGMLDKTGLHTDMIGSEGWWRQVAQRGTPLVTQLADGQCGVLFLWRDPQGDEHHSDTVRVYMDINSVTDHHSPSPTTMVRWPGTDTWCWYTRVPANWRGSYQLIPATERQLPVPSEEYRPERHRQWWIALMAAAQADPLNPSRAHPSLWGGRLSALHMPEAPPQPGWETFERGEQTLPAGIEQLAWQSASLGNKRQIWIYQSGPAHQPLPLVLLLDGRFWATSMPIFAALASQTASGRLPPALYVLIDEIDSDTRAEELPCQSDFWLAVQQELLPTLARQWSFSTEPSRTLIAGQSYGGLAALYAAAHWPERFGCVLSQSGSFWWPDRTLFSPDPIHGRHPGCGGWLTEQLRQRQVSPPLKVWLEAGTREGEMIDLSETISQVLVAGGHQVQFRGFEGGHDRLCWRGGLLDGLAWLLNPVAP